MNVITTSQISAEMSPYLPGECSPYPFDAKSPRFESRLAARDQIEDAGSDDRADHLRDEVRQQQSSGEASACPQAHGHRGIEVAAGNRTECVGPGQHGETERQRDASEADAERGKCGSQHSASAAAEHQPERSEKFERKVSGPFAPFRRAATVALVFV